MWDSRKRFLSFLSRSLRNFNPSPSAPPYTTHPNQFIYQHPQSSPLHACYYTSTHSLMRPKWSCGLPMYFSSTASSHLETLDACCVLDQNRDCIDHGHNTLVDDEQEESSFWFSKDWIDRSRDIEKEVGVISDIIRLPRENRLLVKKKLRQCGVTVSKELVMEVLSQVRNDWEAAFTFFLWAGKQPGYTHSVQAYHSMIAILGRMREFDTAWDLIMEMKGRSRGQSIVTPLTLLIMIRRYCAVHEVGNAINTYYAHKRFGFETGMKEFHGLLFALCRYKNVKDAEHFLFYKEDVFPLNTQSFNIILNGWCNIIGSIPEGERIWREMRESGISYDVYSYSCIISCYSKSGRVKMVLKLFDQWVKTENSATERQVYNAAIQTLVKANRVKDAHDLMKSMEERSMTPDAVTYNSLIMPLCRANQLNEANEVFHEMLKRGLVPTHRTYHAFLDTKKTAEEVFELLQQMNVMGCYPSLDTYTKLVKKFCQWRQFDNVFKLWNEMSKNGLDPDRSSYNALINGLFFNGKLELAYKYYLEMKGKNLLPEPKIEERLQTWVSGKQSLSGGRKIQSLLKEYTPGQFASKTRVASQGTHQP